MSLWLRLLMGLPFSPQEYPKETFWAMEDGFARPGG